uniref:Ig-like domain-containing protein n=1 Tax=Timema cristinae TaxID=61476 RepID=A0A7R9DBS0_TIMCR|nr:unnamed protein product [Timema cristinae]
MSSPFCRLFGLQPYLLTPIGLIDLNKHFEAPPYSQAVEVGGSVELRCHPPLGVPPPTVYWLKNSAPLETDTNLIVSREGHLLVGQARLEDTANYTCVAENVAAHRLSEAARLIVYACDRIGYGKKHLTDGLTDTLGGPTRLPTSVPWARVPDDLTFYPVQPQNGQSDPFK